VTLRPAEGGDEAPPPAPLPGRDRLCGRGPRVRFAHPGLCLSRPSRGGYTCFTNGPGCKARGVMHRCRGAGASDCDPGLPTPMSINLSRNSAPYLSCAAGFSLRRDSPRRGLSLHRSSRTGSRSHGLKPVTHGTLVLPSKDSAEFPARATAPLLRGGGPLNSSSCLATFFTCKDMAPA
jgi:hypothetical protein